MARSRVDAARLPLRSGGMISIRGLRGGAGVLAAVALGRLLVAVAIVAGVLGMHALSPAPAPTTSRGHGHHAVSGPAHHGGPAALSHAGLSHAGDAVPYQDHGGRHPGQVCQSGAVPSGAVPAPSAPGVVEPVVGSWWSGTATAAGDAGPGTGRGPPSLHELSISRT